MSCQSPSAIAVGAAGGDCAAAGRAPASDAKARAAKTASVRLSTRSKLSRLGTELADGRPDFLATGTEWRTAPLWGIGLVETVNHHTNFLHDGRARDLSEAILWHGGEGEAAREAYRLMPESDREAMLVFLESL